MSINSLQDKQRDIEILLVEDNYGDALLLQKAFGKIETQVNINIAEDGAQALAMLAKEGEHKELPTPDLILLDINLPRLNGKDVLAKIKAADSPNKHIPVIMLTSSSAEMDVVTSYQQNANAYIVKPLDLTKISTVVEAIDSFWLKLIVLPDPADFE